MSDNQANEDARRAAARKRLQERQSRREHEGAANPGTHSSYSQRAQSSYSTHEDQEARRPRTQRTSSEPARRRVTRAEAHGAQRTGQTRQAERPSQSGQGRQTEGARQTRQPRTQSNAGANDIVGTLKNVGVSIVDGAKNLASIIANWYRGLIDQFGQRNTLIGTAIAVVLLFVMIFAIRSCATPKAPEEVALDEAKQAASAVSYSNDDGSKPDNDALANLLGAEVATDLLNAASENPEVYWIASHPGSYNTDGTAVQGKLLKLAATEPAAVDFVRNWPDKYPQTEVKDMDTATPSAESTTSIPRFYQWDERWGYTEYSSTTFALTGCCPTSLAMVYQGLTGNTDLGPYQMAQLAIDKGYATEYDGTDASFLVDIAPSLGMDCTLLQPAASNLTHPLEAGQVLIINVGPGDFTANGHFIVATGLTEDGKVIVNDPYSDVRSNETWSVDTLVNQAKAFFAYSY